MLLVICSVEIRIFLFAVQFTISDIIPCFLQPAINESIVLNNHHFSELFDFLARNYARKGKCFLGIFCFSFSSRLWLKYPFASVSDLILSLFLNKLQKADWERSIFVTSTLRLRFGKFYHTSLKFHSFPSSLNPILSDIKFKLDILRATRSHEIKLN